jgi:hypothetical protein
MELRRNRKPEWPEDAELQRISAPPVHEGVGKALRAAYLPRTRELPKDIAALLARLG